MERVKCADRSLPPSTCLIEPHSLWALNKDVKRFRRDHGLCWNCGEGGHFAAACGNPTSLEMPRGARGGGGSARATVMDTTTKASATPAASSAQASGKGESQ